MAWVEALGVWLAAGGVAWSEAPGAEPCGVRRRERTLPVGGGSRGCGSPVLRPSHAAVPDKRVRTAEHGRSGAAPEPRATARRCGRI